MEIPPGFTQLFPYLFVADADAYLRFLADGLGGAVAGIQRNPDNTVANAHVVFGDTTVMVSEARGEFGPTSATYYLYVADADAATRQAETGGASVMFEPVDMPYGDRQSGVIDPAGNVWWLSQRLHAGPY
ncbi:MAG TPA: VOC family protein [Novosphingobium sp.]|nr:VOC family protein [Novosphingobium sp.]